MIMVFPQAAPSDINKSGCWNILVDNAQDQIEQQTNLGTQNKAFKKLIQQLTTARDSGYDYSQLNIAKADPDADRCDPNATLKTQGAMSFLDKSKKLFTLAAVYYFLY